MKNKEILKSFMRVVLERKELLKESIFDHLPPSKELASIMFDKLAQNPEEFLYYRELEIYTYKNFDDSEYIFVRFNEDIDERKHKLPIRSYPKQVKIEPNFLNRFFLIIKNHLNILEFEKKFYEEVVKGMGFFADFQDKEKREKVFVKRYKFGDTNQRIVISFGGVGRKPQNIYIGGYEPYIFAEVGLQRENYIWIKEPDILIKEIKKNIKDTEEFLRDRNE